MFQPVRDMLLRSTNIFLVTSIVLIGTMACGGDTDDVNLETITADPTSSPAPEPTPTPEPTPAPEPTITPVPLEVEPDAANGETLFTAQGCSSCHSTGTNTVVGPGLSGLSKRAGSRVPYQTEIEYVTKSIRSPNAFIVPDFFPDLMPTTFSASMTEEEIADVVAYLLKLP